MIDCNVQSAGYAGGIVGENNGYIGNCYSSSQIRTSESDGYAGGIAAINGNVIQNCYSTCEVSGSANRTGSITGYNA